MADSPYPYHKAIQDFQQARRKAGLELSLARLRGKSADLIPYQEIRARLGATESGGAQLRDIPLDAIVGSVNRYTDFTRSFLPRTPSDQHRWAQVRVGIEAMTGLPPIEVYQMDQVYFVRDGHHRISAVRDAGGTHIQAYVTPVNAPVSFSPEDSPDEVILRAERAAFLKKTRADEFLPEADLTLSAPGSYPRLAEHIAVHRYYMGIEAHRPITEEEGLTHWYHNYYLPVVRAIRIHRLLGEFPGRTETDLYLWLTEHQSELSHQLGWDISPATAARDLAQRFSRRPRRWWQRLRSALYDWILPDPLESGPPAGQWRKTLLNAAPQPDRLLGHILVAVTGQPDGWQAVEYALRVAQAENAALSGLHICPPQSDSQSIEQRFLETCAQAGVPARLAVEDGPVARTICNRAQWADLVVLKLTHAPPLRLVPRLKSGLRTIIRRCPCPLLLVSERPFDLSRVLLAYDASPKAQEALYIAAYLAARFGSELTVLCASPRLETAQIHAEKARAYLSERGIQAAYLLRRGFSAPSLLSAAAEKDPGLILMGGYGGAVLRELFFGSTVDRILPRVKQAVMICH